MIQKRSLSGLAAPGMLRDAKDASKVREALFVTKAVSETEMLHTSTVGAAPAADWRSRLGSIEDAAAGERRSVGAGGLPVAADGGFLSRVVGEHERAWTRTCGGTADDGA
jgi:hypothetical protein